VAALTLRATPVKSLELHGCWVQNTINENPASIATKKKELLRGVFKKSNVLEKIIKHNNISFQCSVREETLMMLEIYR
jgi:hypothetical protein